MAKKAKTEKEGDGHGVSAIRGNGFDPDATKAFVNRIENVQAQIDEHMAEAAKECAPLYEDIDAIKKEAADAGFPRKAFNAAIAERKADRKLKAIRDKLNADQQNAFDQIKSALGTLADTPLGSSALAKAAPKNGAHATA